MNKPLLRTTMELVEAWDQHDNYWYAHRVPGQPASETYCFATCAVLIVYPMAQILWSPPEDGHQTAWGVRLPDGTERSIGMLADELLGIDDDETEARMATSGQYNLFYCKHTKATLRKLVDHLTAD